MQAARYAVDLIQDGMVVGLGTGSTTRYALEALSEKIKGGALNNVVGIPSSERTAKIAKNLKIPLSDFSQFKNADISIDGADEVDAHLNLIKGGGGALLREKILAQASIRFVIIIDESKYSDILGRKWPVPVEVLPFAEPLERAFLESLGAKVVLRHTKKNEVYRTDQNNYIFDCAFGRIADAEALAQALAARSGIMEHGLFINLATDVVVATEEGIRHLQKDGDQN